jgi:SAM-dependent methyltransferase
VDAFYRRFFPNDGDALAGFHQALRDVLPAAGDVLDVGCGDNRQLSRYRSARRRVWGTDSRAHPRLADPAWFRPLALDGSIPFADASMDVVASTWVLEHIRTPRRFLLEVGRVLRPGGAFVSLTVNARHYVSGITRLLHLLPHTVTQRLVYRLYGRAPHDTHPTYFQLNTADRLQSAGHAAGLELTALRRFANPDYFSFLRPLYCAAVLADWCFERLLPGSGRLYMVVTLRKPTASTQRQAA